MYKLIIRLDYILDYTLDSNVFLQKLFAQRIMVRYEKYWRYFLMDMQYRHVYREILHRITDKNVSYNIAWISGRRCKYVTKYVRKIQIRAVHANFQ